MLEGRRDQFVSELRSGGASASAAEREVDAAIDLWVHVAGWSDKFSQVIGSANPVAAPYFNFSLPEPTGVVAAIAPQDADPLLGLSRVLAPAIVSGNAAVVVAHEANPLPALSFAEVVATSDVPKGVVNLLTGPVAELAPILAGHMEVNAIDLAGVDDAAALDLEALAAENLKRVVRPRPAATLRREDTLVAIQRLIELKTVWHPIGV
jgi:acyl-CoA reductase-like NAD-dependent aldehyde dehydrogenase